MQGLSRGDMSGVGGAGIIRTFVMRNYRALCLALLVSTVDGRADGIAVERNCYGNMSGEEVGRLSLSVSVCVNCCCFCLV